METVEAKIAERAMADERVKLLESVPGISHYSAVGNRSRAGDWLIFGPCRVEKCAGPFCPPPPRTPRAVSALRPFRSTVRARRTPRWTVASISDVSGRNPRRLPQFRLT